MSVPIKPLADYVVAQQEEAETKTASGLYLPGNAQEKPKVAKVLAIGQKVDGVKVGDRIIYGGYSNEVVKYGGTEYILIKAENIFATVK
ncbi:MAG TPA: co-chaperone GroES [Candidatus Limnocylindrales bacterium]|nr:co-chaperone GroES [Candidatus Limnocylindrales bacterium]